MATSEQAYANSRTWESFVRLTDEQLLAFCKVDVFKSRGKGGQKKNKTSNAIRLRCFHLSALGVNTRSKNQNLQIALHKMRLEFAQDLNYSRPSRSIISEDLVNYFQNGKLRMQIKNPFYPLLIGQMLDLWLNTNQNWQKMAEALGLSKSQIRKWFVQQPALAKCIQKLHSLATADSI